MTAAAFPERYEVQPDPAWESAVRRYAAECPADVRVLGDDGRPRRTPPPEWITGPATYALSATIGTDVDCTCRVAGRVTPADAERDAYKMLLRSLGYSAGRLLRHGVPFVIESVRFYKCPDETRPGVATLTGRLIVRPPGNLP